MDDSQFWYSIHYTIVDAEIKLEKLYSKLNIPNTGLTSATTIETNSEMNNDISTKKDESEAQKDEGQDQEGFHVVHRRKRIPSSTTHPQETTTTPPVLSPYIDLEPVVLHGHPDATVTTPPTILETTTVSTKKKHKKKKKNSEEEMLFDAPELKLSDESRHTIDETKRSEIKSDQTSQLSPTKDSQEQTSPMPQQSMVFIDGTTTEESQIIHSEHDRISLKDEVTTEISKEKNELHDKPSAVKLQIMDDNDSRYSTHHTIVDAETKMEQPYTQLNILNTALPSPITIETNSEMNKDLSANKDESEVQKDEDQEGFEVVHRRKRVPSSTSHPQETPTTPPVLSPYIDLETVVLHGHPDATVSAPPAVLETSTVSSQKKHKKKKKNSEEEMLFDAPELILSNENKEVVDKNKSARVKAQESQYVEAGSTFQTNEARKEKRKQKKRLSKDAEDSSNSSVGNETKKNEFTPENDVQSISASSIAAGENIKLLSKSHEESISDKSACLEAPTAQIIKTAKVITVPPEEDDNEGFQVVHYHKRILAAVKTQKTPATEITILEDKRSPIIAEKLSGTDKNEPSSHSTNTAPETTSLKNKKNKHKKQKQENVTSADVDFSNTQQKTTHEDDTSVLMSSIIEDSNVKSKETKTSVVTPIPIISKTSPSSEEQEDDNDGFQVVRYRKHTSTSLQSQQPSPSSSKTKNFSPKNVSADIDHKPAVTHGRHDSAPRSTPRITPVIKTPSNKNEQDKNETSSFNNTPRSASTDSHNRTPTSLHSSSETTEKVKQKTKTFSSPIQKNEGQDEESQGHASIDVKTASMQSSSTQSSITPIDVPSYTLTNDGMKILHEQSLTDKIISSIDLNKVTTSNQQQTSSTDHAGDNDGFQIAHHRKQKTSPTTAVKQTKATSPIDIQSANISTKQDSSTVATTSTVLIEETTSSKQKSKKSKKKKEHSLPSIVPNNDSTQINPNVNQDQQTKDNIQKDPSLITTIINIPLSTAIDLPLDINTSEIISSSTDVKALPTVNVPNEIQSLVSHLETPKPSNELANTINSISTVVSTESITDARLTSSDILPASIQIKRTETPPSPTTTAKDEQNKTVSNEKTSKRRKKKVASDVKTDNKTTSTSSPNISAQTHTDKQKSDPTPAPKSIFTEPTIHSTKMSQQTTAVKQSIIHSTPATSEPLTSISSQSAHHVTDTKFDNETNSKLDLFLPDYIRQQINERQSNPLSTTHATENSSITTTVTASSDITQKKKQRAKMLTKDPEAKSLLTNEFDCLINTSKSHTSQIVSTDDENIKDDDESIIQINAPNKSQVQINNVSNEQNIDNILSLGIRRWLQEGQALSQPKDKSTSSRNLTNAMQSIIIQPAKTNENNADEKSFVSIQTIQPTFTTDLRTEKRIHINHAYFINHPHSISSSSCVIVQPNKDTFDDHSKDYDSDDEEDSTKDKSKKQDSHQPNGPSLTKQQQQQQSNVPNDYHSQLTFTTDDVQRCLGEDFYYHMNCNNNRNNNNNNNNTISFDDWAQFPDDKNPYRIEYDPSTQLECFYAETLDEDTLVSSSLPNNYPSQYCQQQRYGDFSKSDNEILISESVKKIPEYKSRPSQTFQRWRKHEPILNQFNDDNDDEIFISHSNNGLCRQVTP